MYSVQYMTRIWSSLRWRGVIAFSILAWSRKTAQRYHGFAQRRSERDGVVDWLISWNLYHPILLRLLGRADADAFDLFTLELSCRWVDLDDRPGPVFRLLGIA